MPPDPTPAHSGDTQEAEGPRPLTPHLPIRGTHRGPGPAPFDPTRSHLSLTGRRRFHADDAVKEVFKTPLQRKVWFPLGASRVASL